jgi:osmotically inducible protein OsmC
MSVRNASAQWNGTLKDGNGTMKYGTYEGSYSFASRFEDGEGTNPEELAGAAHAGCYSMFLSALLSGQGITPTRIETKASVHLGRVDDAPKITQIDLVCEAQVAGIDEDAFLKHAEEAKKGCPISKLFAGTEINLSAKLV